MWTPDRVRRAIDAHDRGDFAESVDLAQAVTRQDPERIRSIVRMRCACGGMSDTEFFLMFGYWLVPVPVPLPFVRPIAPWHPFADAPRGEP